MASKYTKVPVNESGPFTTSNNLLQLQMDDIGVSDLSESYLDLEVSFQDAGGNDTTDTVSLGDQATGVFYSTGCFIKNFRLEAEKQPFVCEERYRNRLGETMRSFYKGSEERKASKIYGNEEVKIDANSRRGHCLIPFPDLAPIGKLMYPNYAMGKTTLKLELEDRVPLAYLKRVAKLGMRATFAVNDVDNSGGGADLNQDIFRLNLPFDSQATATEYLVQREFVLAGTLNGAAVPNNTKVVVDSIQAFNVATGIVDVKLTDAITIDAGETFTNISFSIADADTFACNDVANGGGAAADIMTVVVPASSPSSFEVGAYYHVGYFEATSSGVVPADKYKFQANPCILQVVQQNGADTTLVFSSPLLQLPNAKTAVLMFITKQRYATEALTYKVHKCDLVISKPLKWQPMKEFAYSTMSLEMVNMIQSSDWRRQYELEPECDALMLLTPNATLLSERDNLTSYRNAINSIDTTTEDVVIDNANNGSLYYDMILKNIDDVKSLQPYNFKTEVVVISERVAPPTDILNNVIEFRLISAVNPMTAKVVYLFKRLQKMVKL